MQNLQKDMELVPKKDVAALPTHSKITPDADVLRKQAKDAMARNAIAEALRFMEQADDIEARAEAEALRRAERLHLEAQDARGIAMAQSISRAQTQSAHASILFDLSDFDGAKRLYKSAIQRLPPSETELRAWYGKKLRITLNSIAARIRQLDSVKSVLFESGLAAPLDRASYSILIRRAPDYPTARAVLGEMTEAGITPNVITFNSLITAAPDYPTARAVLGEMTEAGITPDVITFNSLITAAPDYPTARAMLGEMTEAGITPDVITFSSLITAAPDYPTARACWAR
ncbi:MAG: hypothetical protein WBW81_06590 [Methylocella sp.]